MDKFVKITFMNREYRILKTSIKLVVVIEFFQRLHPIVTNVVDVISKPQCILPQSELSIQGLINEFPM